MSKQLLSLQQDFQHYLLGDHHRILQSIVTTKEICAKSRLNIYQEAYVSRLLESLQHDYPVLATLMGESLFTKLGRAYIATYPSTFRSVRWFGQHFSEFIYQQNSDEFYHFFSEMAVFEWTLATVFDAENHDSIGEIDLQKIMPEQWAYLKFNMHPSLHCIDFFWNVVPIWKSIHKEEKKYPTPKKRRYAKAWMIWRQDLETYFHPLKSNEAWAMRAMQSGQVFSAVCEGLSRWVGHNEVAVHIAQLLKFWLHISLIVAIETTEPVS